MKTLFLIRHAKSDWSLHESDVNRIITEKGKKNSQKVATELLNFSENNDVFPTLFLSSIAKRAQLTAEIVTNFYRKKYTIEKDLYTFSVSELKQVVFKFPDEHDCIMIFGHNEAFTDFIHEFGSIEIDNLPTSAAAIIQFPVQSWNEILKGDTRKIIIAKNL